MSVRHLCSRGFSKSHLCSITMHDSPFGCRAELIMNSVPVGNKTLPLPALVPSISSFETQLDPIAALQLQYILHEPISLVSAYDIKQLGKNFENLCRRYQESAVLLLDSGGYEHSTAVRYAADQAPNWTVDDFKVVCALPIYDFVFSFDYFWCEKDHGESAV